MKVRATLPYSSRVLSAELSLPPNAASVSVARRFLADALEQWQAPELAWAAAQLVSELATNAVLHARTTFTVRLDLDGEILRIAVGDASPTGPTARHYAPSATTGRGLTLLASLSRAWGSEPTADGKWVWCEVSSGTSDGRPHLDADELMEAFDDPIELSERRDDGSTHACSVLRLVA